MCDCVWSDSLSVCVLYALLNDWLMWPNTAFGGPKPGCENVEGAAVTSFVLFALEVWIEITLF